MSLRLHALVASAFAAGAVLSACSSTSTAGTSGTSGASAASSGQSCFFPSEVNGFSPVRNKGGPDNAIVVSVGANKSYLFQTLGPCPDIDWTETIGFDQDIPGQICSGIDVDLIVPSDIGPQRCAVRMIRPLTPEEAKSY